MIATSRPIKCVLTLLLYLLHMAAQVSAGTQFASHVSVNTPARSFTHGVGDPISALERRPHRRQPEQHSLRSRHPAAIPLPRGGGYPRVKPTVPFNIEEIPRDNSRDFSPWRHNNYMEMAIPLLPPSPYKVDSADPESLWPEGLFLPPVGPPRFGTALSRRSDNELENLDPYLLEGPEAVAAVQKAKQHGHLYFHEIPHIDSLLANQEIRVQNHLKPHLIASIRYTWPYNRP